MLFLKYIHLFWLVMVSMRINECSSSITHESLKEYLSYKNINSLVIVACSERDAVDVMGAISNYKQFLASAFSPCTTRHLEILLSKSVKVGISIDVTCECGLTYLKTNFEDVTVSGYFSWLIWGGKSNLSTMYWRIDSDVVIATPMGAMYEVYKVSEDSGAIYNFIGKWDQPSGLQITNRPKRDDLKGIQLKGSLVLTDLQIPDEDTLEEKLVEKSYYPELDILNRYHYVLYRDLQHIYNFKTELKITDSWGYKQTSGSFDGMIGELENGTVDFGISPCQQKEDRMDAVDFLIPFHNFRMCFIFRQPRALGTYRALGLPFAQRVWAFLAFLIVLSASCLYAITRTTKYGRSANSFIHGILIGVGVFAQQGFILNTGRASTRALGLAMLLTGVMVSAYYNAAIMNGLLSPSQNFIRTVDQLIESPLIMGMLDIPYLTHRVTPNDPVTRTAYKRMMKSGPLGVVKLVADGMELVRRGRYAFYAEDTIMYAQIDKTFSDSEKCDLKEVELLPSFMILWTVKKNSPYREIFKQGVLKLREAGIPGREDKAWYSQKSNCLGSQSVPSVSLEAVTVALGAFTTGFILSLVIFLVEHLYFNYTTFLPRRITLFPHHLAFTK